MFCEASTSGNYAYNGSKSANLTKINRTFSLSISQGSNTTVVVNRTSSPLGGSIGRLYNGSTLYKGDIISISFSAATGCELTTHTINGTPSASGYSYEVTSAISIVTRATVNSFALSITVDANTNLTVNRTSSPLQGASQGYLSNGATIYYGDVLNIVFSAKQDILSMFIQRMVQRLHLVKLTQLQQLSRLFFPQHSIHTVSAKPSVLD